MISQTQANTLAKRLERIVCYGYPDPVGQGHYTNITGQDAADICLAVEVLRGNHVDLDIKDGEIDWRRERVVASMPGKKLTPETVLARTMEKLEHIDAVYVAIRWKDTSIDADWSQMPVSALCTMLVNMQITVHDVVNDRLRDDDDD